jgi:hypothetical protein
MGFGVENADTMASMVVENAVLRMVLLVFQSFHFVISPSPFLRSLAFFLFIPIYYFEPNEIWGGRNSGCENNCGATVMVVLKWSKVIAV